MRNTGVGKGVREGGGSVNWRYVTYSTWNNRSVA
jgi:hypothetical protein